MKRFIASLSAIILLVFFATVGFGIYFQFQREPAFFTPDMYSTILLQEIYNAVQAFGVTPENAFFLSPILVIYSLLIPSFMGR